MCNLCASVKMPYDHFHKAMLLDELFDTVRAMEQLPWASSILGDLDALDNEELLEVLRQIPVNSPRFHINVLPPSLRQLSKEFLHEQSTNTAAAIAAAAESISASGQTGPRMFTLFPDLPAEIRLVIWKHALPDPTVIEVTEEADLKVRISRHVQNALAPLKRTCHEAKGVVTKHYQQIPQSVFKSCHTVNPLAASMLYFNPQHNTVYISGIPTLVSLTMPNNVLIAPGREALECIAVRFIHLRAIMEVEDASSCSFRTLKGLKKVLVVMNDGTPWGVKDRHQGVEIEFHPYPVPDLHPNSSYTGSPKELSQQWDEHFASEDPEKKSPHVKLEFVVMKRKNPQRYLSDKIRELAEHSKAISDGRVEEILDNAPNGLLDLDSKNTEEANTDGPDYEADVKANPTW